MANTPQDWLRHFQVMKDIREMEAEKNCEPYTAPLETYIEQLEALNAQLSTANNGYSTEVVAMRVCLAIVVMGVILALFWYWVECGEGSLTVGGDVDTSGDGGQAEEAEKKMTKSEWKKNKKARQKAEKAMKKE